jgi:Bacterial regulatory protein, Fis family
LTCGVLTRTATARPLWGRLRILDSVGDGRLYKVSDGDTGVARALRIVSREPASPLVRDELEQIARLRHPSLPRVHEVGWLDAPHAGHPVGAPYLLTDWVTGTPCDRPPVPAGLALAVLGEVAGALAAIHRAGLVHAHVAPHNILITPTGTTLLVGLAPRRSGDPASPPYLAPEARGGVGGPGGDLYALGVTIARLRSQAGLGVERERASAGAGELAALLASMTASDPAARPASAHAVLDALDALSRPGTVARGRASLAVPGGPDPDREDGPRAAPWRATPGRRPQPAWGALDWPGAAAASAAIARAWTGDAAVILIVGEPASGACELVERAVRPRAGDATDGDAAAQPVRGSLDEVGAALAVGADPGSPRGWIARVARAARRATAPVVIELGDDPRARALIVALTCAPGGHPVIAVADRDPIDRPMPGLVRHVAPRLDREGIAALAGALLGAAPPRGWAHALHVATGGAPRLATELVRSIASEPQPFAVDWTARLAAGRVELRARQLRAAPPGARRIAAAIAAWGGRVRIDRALGCLRGDGKQAAILADVAELERLGLGARRGDDVAIDRDTAEAIERVAGTEALARLASAALAGLADAPGSPLAWPLAIPLLERAPLDADRAALACSAADDLVSRGLPERGLALARRAVHGAPAQAALIAARAASAAGAWREAATYAREAAAAGADALLAGVLGADALAGAGELDAADALLASLDERLADVRGDAAARDRRAELAGHRARLLVARGRHREARAVLAVTGSDTALAAEAAGRAALALGELPAAAHAFAALEARAAASGDTVTSGRAAALQAQLACERGQLALACDRYRAAARQLDELGELAAAAACEAALGRALIDRGRASCALAPLASAARRFAALEDRAAWGAAALARGTALARVGQLDAAAGAAAAVVAAAGDAPGLRAAALVLIGDTRHRLGDPAAGTTALHAALALATTHDDRPGQLAAHLALTAVGRGAADDAAVAALCASDDDRDRWTLARGRRALVAPATRPAPAAEALCDATAQLARACGQLAGRATQADRLLRAFHGHALAAQLAHRAGDAAYARGQLEHARLAHAAVAAATAPAFRAAVDGDPDLARVHAAQLAQAGRDADARIRAAFTGVAARDAELAARDAELAARDAELAALRDRLPHATPGHELRLKPVLAAAERTYVAAAMARTGGNQTAAARLLGLSRFGLQKKLRRLADESA